MIRVLVVDDSSFMRQALSRMLNRASGVTVVDTAVNGKEGVKKACELDPDVVTMDVEMPKMDGITAVRRIMERAPCPILMVSSLTEEGAETTIEAMEAGAADFISKGQAGSALRIREVENEIIEKVRALSQSQSRLFEGDLTSEGDATSSEARDAAPSTDGELTSSAGQKTAVEGGRADSSLELVVIGVSTGGPLALQHVLPALPAELPVPVAVTQHMPSEFTSSLADRLDTLSALHVEEATDGMVLDAGQIVVAAGGHHLTFERREDELVAHTPTEPGDTSHCPSVDVMFGSACDVYGGRVLALVMTGMGKDGLEGTRRIKEAGGTVFAQDEASSVVYGMPRAVAEAGLTDGVVPLDELSAVIGETAGTPVVS